MANWGAVAARVGGESMSVPSQWLVVFFVAKTTFFVVILSSVFLGSYFLSEFNKCKLQLGAELI